MSVLRAARGPLDRLCRGIALIGFGALVLLCIAFMADALARRLGLPRLHGLGDLAEVLFPLLIAGCFPAGLLHDQNVKITALGGRLGPRAARWLDAVAALAVLAVFAVIGWQFIAMTLDFQAAGRTTSTILLPAAPWWWATSAVILLCLPVQLWMVVARLTEALGGPALVDEHALAETLGEAELATEAPLRHPPE